MSCAVETFCLLLLLRRLHEILLRRENEVLEGSPEGFIVNRTGGKFGVLAHVDLIDRVDLPD
jgi:hypothetical protein